jgi:hypothetical protein
MLRVFLRNREVGALGTYASNRESSAGSIRKIIVFVCFAICNTQLYHFVNTTVNNLITLINHQQTYPLAGTVAKHAQRAVVDAQTFGYLFLAVMKVGVNN